MKKIIQATLLLSFIVISSVQQKILTSDGVKKMKRRLSYAQ